MSYKYSFYNIVIEENDDYVYIFNSFAGSFCELTRQVYDTIVNNENILTDIEYFGSLNEEGIIVPAQLDEYNRIIALENDAMYSQDTEHICDVIALTMRCNMNCEYCFEAKRNRNVSVDKEIIPKIIDFIKNQITSSKRIKTFAIQWFGGEPMLEYDYILQISDVIKAVCEENNVSFESSILTNGLLMTAEKTETMIDRCNLRSIQISLDGLEEMYCRVRGVSKNTYDAVINNIVDIAHLSDKVKIAIRLNASKKNIEDLKELSEILLSKYQLKDKVFIYLAEIKDYTKCFEKDCSVFKSGEFEIVKNEFYKFLQEKYGAYKESFMAKKRFAPSYCRLICASNFAIGPNGELYKCDQSIGNPDHIVGDVVNGLYYNESYNNLCNVEHFEKCKQCKVFPLCLSGCKSAGNTFGEKSVDCNGQILSLKNVLKRYY